MTIKKWAELSNISRVGRVALLTGSLCILFFLLGVWTGVSQFYGTGTILLAPFVISGIGWCIMSCE